MKIIHWDFERLHLRNSKTKLGLLPSIAFQPGWILTRLRYRIYNGNDAIASSVFERHFPIKDFVVTREIVIELLQLARSGFIKLFAERAKDNIQIQNLDIPEIEIDDQMEKIIAEVVLFFQSQPE
jgi:hypothetical protein